MESLNGPRPPDGQTGITFVLVVSGKFTAIKIRIPRQDTAWNRACDQAHAVVFKRVRLDVPLRCGRGSKSVAAAIFYEDAYSPFCLIAECNEEAEVIYESPYRLLPPPCRYRTVVRNDVCAAPLSRHEAYNKGTALAEIARQIGVAPEETFAAGDHLNDLPMLSRQHAHWLAAPANAVPAIKEVVRGQEGFVSELSHGHGVAEGLEFHLKAKA